VTRRKEMNTTIRGHNLRARVVMALLTVLIVLTVALVFALRPAPTTSDRDANPAIHTSSADGTGRSSITEDPIHRHVEVVQRLGNLPHHAMSADGKKGSSIPQNPDVERHAEVVERLGNGSVR
jgi:hypothetical protein